MLNNSPVLIVADWCSYFSGSSTGPGINPATFYNFKSGTKVELGSGVQSFFRGKKRKNNNLEKKLL